MYCETVRLYENREDVTLTTYVLEDTRDMLNGKPRPAVLICPGGGYLTLSDREGEPVALAFAHMGYHAFVLKYSVYSQGVQNEDMFAAVGEGRKEHCIFPKPMQDIGAAMLYIREHSGQWHVNMEQVAVCGFSAGAHNCAMYGAYWDKPEIAGFFGKDPEMMRPAACILGYPLTDYIYMKEYAAHLDPEEIAGQLFVQSNMAYLGTTEPDEELLKAISPARLVSGSTPPTFLWATGEDNLVPVQHTILMARALADGKVPFEVHIFESGPHGLGVATEAGAGNLWDVNREAAQWVPMCHAWLRKRFKLALEKRPFWAQFA